MKRTWIKDVRIVNEGKIVRGSVVVEDEEIAEVREDNLLPARPCEEVVEGKGYYLLPGVIDDHVHFRDPGLTYKADLHTESMAAAAGGVTSFMDMPNTLPQTVTLEALEAKFAAAAERSVVNYSFYFGATADNVALFPLLDKHRVCGIKLFMGSSTGNMLVDREDALRRIFTRAGMLIAVHCEDSSLINARAAVIRERYGDEADVAFHPWIRSAEACLRSSSLAVRLARETGARLHILHVSTARELELFEDQPLAGKRVTAEVCVPHLLFCEEDYETLGTRIKCNPAIKTRADREALRNALSTHRVDVIGTDHAPHLWTEKAGGALNAASGMPLIQFSLIAVMELVHEGVWSVEQLVQKMCHAPADLYGIEKRGYIRPGYRADLVLVNPDAEWTVTTGCIRSKCGWSPLEGRSFHARVDKTFVNGHLVYADDRVDETYRGQALEFERWK